MRAFRGSDRIIDSAILMEWFWEKSAREGESPVHERRADMAGIQSTMRHVEPCGNKRGPPRKPKYSLVTDSA